MTRHSRRAGPALRSLMDTDPAMAALSLWCDHRDGDTPVAQTCGTIITYGPGFDALPRHEQAGVAAHHILHVALRHSARMAGMGARFGDGFEADLYAIAADAVVNEALVQSAYALPRPALTLTGLLADLDGTAPPAAEALAQWDVDRLYIRLTQQNGGADRAADRARAHVRMRVFAPDLDSTAQTTEPGDGADEALWRQHLSRALEAGRLAGRGIGLLGHRWADIRPADTPWEVVLRGLVTRSLAEAAQPTYRRPARRWVAMEAEARRSGGPSPAFEPGVLRRIEVPRVIVCLDASSSIDEARLGMLLGEIAGIVRRLAAEVWIIPFDEFPREAVRIDPARWRSTLEGLDLPRGGGTDFGPVIAAAVHLRPSVIVILTDLVGPLGPPPRAVPVIWAVPSGSPPAPTFGRVVSLAR